MDSSSGQTVILCTEREREREREEEEDEREEEHGLTMTISLICEASNPPRNLR